MLAAKQQSLHGALAGRGGSSEEALLGLASGVIFGFVNPAVGHPFDSVKTRMQADPLYKGTGFAQTVKGIYRVDGIRGFYRGFLPPLVGSMAFRGLQFSAYAGAFAACEHVPVLHDPIPYTGGLRTSVVVGGIAAGFARAVIESPLDYIKLRYMIGKNVLDHAPPSSSSFATSPMGSIMQLYRGFFPTLLRTVGLMGSFFVAVDYSVRCVPDIVNAPLIGPFFKGGLCATFAWFVAFPFESAKSALQADTTGKYKKMRFATFYVMKRIYNERGLVGGLYRGFGPGGSRSFVANGTSMLAYSFIQDLLRGSRRV